jgi:A/G-specific adenine glycosylase
MAVDSPETIYPQLAANLLHWYDNHARSLPWRAPPGSPAPDPYRVWLSEIMLQQTTVAAVQPYFAKFTERWPTIAALAQADEGELMAAWAGLGYYARARNLLACARMIAWRHGGRFPGTEEALRALPGIGAYTAAAIAAIAFGQRAVVVDANVERVISRLFAIETPLPASRSRIRALTGDITPGHRAGDFAQAMMDLGSTICTVRAPKCLLCPIAAHCAGRSDPGRYPARAAKPVRPERRGAIFWVEHDDRVLLHRRPAKGLLGGMIALPTGPWTTDDPGLAGAPVGANWRPLGTIRHVFTHFALAADVYSAETAAAADDEIWWPIDRIGEAGMPTIFAKAASLATKAIA